MHRYCCALRDRSQVPRSDRLNPDVTLDKLGTDGGQTSFDDEIVHKYRLSLRSGMRSSRRGEMSTRTERHAEKTGGPGHRGECRLDLCHTPRVRRADLIGCRLQASIQTFVSCMMRAGFTA
jgi:hypothetical protein